MANTQSEINEWQFEKDTTPEKNADIAAENTTEKKTEAKTAEDQASIANELKESQIVFVIGGPGAGKGTQCKRLGKDLDIVHVSVGDILRDKAARELASTGQESKITQTMREGGLVDTEDVQKALSSYLVDQVREGRMRFLVDGFPRTVDKVELLKPQGLEPIAVLNFDCSRETMLKRVLNRGKESGRVDDNEKTFEERSKAHSESSNGIVQFYGEKVHRIDCEGELSDIYETLRERVETVFHFEPMSEA